MSDLVLEPLAAVIDWHLADAQSALEWQSLFNSYLEALARKSAAEDNTVIGHIKGFVELAENDFIQISVVSAGRPATGSIKEVAANTYDRLTLTLNFLVYGLPYEQAQSIAEQAANEIMAAREGHVEFRKFSDRTHTSHHHH